MLTQTQPALVGVVPRKELWPIIQKEKWYHIPVESAPNNISFVEYLAFTFQVVLIKNSNTKSITMLKF